MPNFGNRVEQVKKKIAIYLIIAIVYHVMFV